MGGDEFAIVMRELDDPTEALSAAWRLVTAFRSPFPYRGGELFATASIGVALATGHAHAEDLLREADTALFVAKAEGRDRVSVFNEELRSAVTTRLTVEGELRHALERGQLAVWYQPEIDLRTGAVIAVEALSALAPPQRRDVYGGPVHRHRRGDGPDPGHRSMGSARGLHSGPRLGERPPGPAVDRPRQCQRPPAGR